MTPQQDETVVDSKSSLLTSSQTSSPSQRHIALNDISLLKSSLATRSPKEDDIISLPETSISGYEDAETYSPMSRSPRMSPPRIHTTLSPFSDSVQSPTETRDNLVSDIGMTFVLPVAPFATQHGPMSVVSMGESEGDDWRSESDWEAV